MADDPLVTSLVEELQRMRDAEREIFNTLDPVVRDGPMRPGDWSAPRNQPRLHTFCVFGLRNSRG